MASAMAYGSTMNMRDLELRSMIKFLTKEGKELTVIHERMNAVYGDVSPSYYRVKFWVGNRLKVIHVQVGQWKHLQRKCVKKWRT